jgi:hypothetical protein
MNSKYTRNRSYRDFKFVDGDEPTPKRAILLKKNKSFLERLYNKIKNLFKL